MVDVAPRELVQLSAVIVPDTDPVRVYVAVGSVIAKVYPVAPVILKAAAVGDPVLEGGRVAPPVTVRVGVPAAAGRVTTPAAAFKTATVPKFISATCVIAIGVMIVPVATAVAKFCPKETAVNPKIAIAKTINFFMIFIF